MNLENKTVMILCGGKGTRLRDVSELLPKPLVNIGEYPIVWHIMKCYAAFGIKNFILCLGYKSEYFIDYFLNYNLKHSDITIELGSNNVKIHNDIFEKDWKITLVQTGLETMTGKRVEIASKYISDDEDDFFLTYGDGLCDVNIEDLYLKHISSNALLTITSVKPEARFGTMKTDDKGFIIKFEEKHQTACNYINGGFMVMNKDFIIKYLKNINETMPLEKEPMSKCAKEHNLYSYFYDGFWQCMDNQREYILLNEMWKNDPAWTKYWTK